MTEGNHADLNLKCPKPVTVGQPRRIFVKAPPPLAFLPTPLGGLDAEDESPWEDDTELTPRDQDSAHATVTSASPTTLPVQNEEAPPLAEKYPDDATASLLWDLKFETLSEAAAGKTRSKFPGELVKQ